ncbi:MAG: hypothetical protein GY749_33015 [Desulfobacteraceae bacterium]|nr:hypothetical protein [Desulfobacteraceae bacterium]
MKKNILGMVIVVIVSFAFIFSAAAAYTEVISLNPGDKAVGVNVSTDITVTFSGSMNPSTINGNTFFVTTGTLFNWKSIAGTVTYSGSTAKFSPTSSLEYETIYNVTVTTGVIDTDGNALKSDYMWSFTTGSASASDVFAGNINGDDKVDIADAILALQICAGIMPTSNVKKDASISGYEKVGLEDAIYVLQIVSEIRTIISAEAVTEIVNTQNSGAEQFGTFLQNATSEEDAKQLTVEWLLKQKSNVADAGISASGDIWINYESGLTGSIIIRKVENDVSSRISSVNVNEYTKKAYTRSSDDDDAVVSKKAFIYAPFYTINTNENHTEFTDQIADLLNKSDYPKYDVVYYKDEECTIDSFKKIKESGLVVIHTHGNIIKNKDGMEYHCFATGSKLPEKIEGDYFELVRNLASQWTSGELTVGTPVEYLLYDFFPMRYNTYWGICSPFITNKIGSSSNTIIYNGSCTSSHPDAPHPTLEEAFLGLNSKNAYLGWTKNVYQYFNKETAEKLFPKLVTEHMTTGDAYDSLFPKTCDDFHKPDGKEVACLHLGGNKNAYIKIDIADASATTPVSGSPPLTVNFSAQNSNEIQYIKKYEWDFTSDGIYDWESAVNGETAYTYDSAGKYTATLRVTYNSNRNAIDIDSLGINVINDDNLLCECLNYGSYGSSYRKQRCYYDESHSIRHYERIWESYLQDRYEISFFSEDGVLLDRYTQTWHSALHGWNSQPTTPPSWSEHYHYDENEQKHLWYYKDNGDWRDEPPYDCMGKYDDYHYFFPTKEDCLDENDAGYPLVSEELVNPTIQPWPVPCSEAPTTRSVSDHTIFR